MRHARRLRRDATALGLLAPEEDALAEALVALGRERLGHAAGVVRLGLGQEPARADVPASRGSVRALGAEPRQWRVRSWAGVHPGPEGAPGVKREGVPAYLEARAAAAQAGADEALLFDAGGFLVEGARTNAFVVRDDGALVTPPLAAGAVAGVAREIVLEGIPEAREEPLPRALLARAREIVLVNAVRGAVRVSHLDGFACGRDDAPWTARLDALLRSDPPPRRG